MSVARRVGLGSHEVRTSHAEIAAWCSLSGIALMPWEAQTVHDLSGYYVHALNRYADTDELPPWMPPGARERAEEQLRDFERDFGAMPARTPPRNRD